MKQRPPNEAMPAGSAGLPARFYLQRDGGFMGRLHDFGIAPWEHEAAAPGFSAFGFVTPSEKRR